MPVIIEKGPAEGLYVIKPKIWRDERGFFLETYRKSKYAAAGFVAEFVQDNLSRSARGVVRGMHYQLPPHAQGKLVRVVAGRIWDVVVDLRPDSPTYRKWFSIELDALGGTGFYVPPGFAHGFLSLEDDTEVLYKCTAEYDRDSERGFRWDDPGIGIRWPDLGCPHLVCERDAGLPAFDPDAAIRW